MGKLIDLTGKRFGRLTVLKRANDWIDKNGKKYVRWECKCDCGNISYPFRSSLMDGSVKSCGCYHSEKSSEAGKKSLENLVGKQYGRLTVIKRAENNGSQTMWQCKCDCGKLVVVNASKLKSKHTQSCGCLQKERTSIAKKTHGMSDSRLHRIWAGMKRRCYNKNDASYENYGGRGIIICDEWKDSFESFYQWAIQSGYSDRLSIDRINVDGNYEPSNCRWADKITQMNNTTLNRTFAYNGETLTVAELSRKYNIPYKLLHKRLCYLNWDIEKAIRSPKGG